MLFSEFDFELPDDLIAQHPTDPRDRSRLMVVNRRDGRWEHRTFAELPELLAPHDVLARNNTRVIPARLVGRRVLTGGRWEGLFLRERPGGAWQMLATTRGQPMPGEQVIVGQGLHLVLEARGGDGSWIVRPERFGADDKPTLTLLEQHGQTPLPPYIRHGHETPGDRLVYQTVYAQYPGAVAAPTAGLHFTERVFARLAVRDITWVDLTLHIGLGTFRPIEVDRIEDHVMHTEWGELSSKAVDLLEARRHEGARIVAVGTTSARTLETAAAGESLQPFWGETQLFIQPGYVFRRVDALITNFHLPRSTPLVLVSAMAGIDLIRKAYADAVRNRYRFFSYGDAMLII